MAGWDPYQVLCVERGVGDDELKRAFRRLARKYHPDKNPDDPDTNHRFREIVEAYGLLSDSEQRSFFDKHGHVGRIEDSNKRGPSETGGGFKDFVGGVLGDLFSDRNRKRGKDLTYKLELSFEEAALGCERTIAFDGPCVCPECGGIGGDSRLKGAVEDCPSCRGAGRVKVGPVLLGATRVCPTCGGCGKYARIPCGNCDGEGVVTRTRGFSVKVPESTKDGTLRVVRGKGAPGVRGGEPGDLQILIKVKKHPVLIIEKGELVCEIPVSPMEATLGCVVGVPSLDGVVDVEIPPGCSSGQVLRLAGRGLPGRNGKRGDIMIRLRVETPVNLTARQEKAMEELAASMKEDQLPGVFDFRAKVDKLS